MPFKSKEEKAPPPGSVIEPRGRNFIGYFRVTINGERTRVGHCKGDNREAVMKSLWEFLRSGELARASTPDDTATILTGPFIENWFKSKLPSWAETTRDTNTQNFNKHVKSNATFWNMPLAKQGYASALAFLDSVGGQNGSSNTKRNVMRLIRPAFDRAVKLEHIKSNPFDLLEKADKPKKSKSRIVYFREDQMQKLLRYVNRPAGDPLWRALVLFGFDYGAEPEEFLAVQLGDFNWTTGRCHIQRTCVEAKGRDGKLRVIVKAEMKADKRHRNERVSQRTLDAVKALVGVSTPLSAHVFSIDGKPWSYDVFYKLWRKLLKEAGVDHLPPLSMRHTMATMMLSQGKPLPAVSKRLGHASSVTTLTHYVHAIPNDSDLLADVSESIFGQMLGEKSPQKAAYVQAIGPRIGPQLLE